MKTIAKCLLFLFLQSCLVTLKNSAIDGIDLFKFFFFSLIIFSREEKQLTSFRVQKTRYGRKMFLFWPSGSLLTSELSLPLAFVPAHAINEVRNQSCSHWST